MTTAALRILKPLVRILLRNGIAYGTFAELVRKTYVDVGFESLAASGKRPTISAVSGITGLTRKETKRLHDMEAPDSRAADQRYNRAVRVISGWFSDKRYLDERGHPRELPLEGELSFTSLVKQYSGDIPAAAMLAVLADAGSVEVIDKRCCLKSSAYIPGRDPEEKIHILGVDGAELLATIDHNLTAPLTALRFQRKVSNPCLDRRYLREFQILAAAKTQALLEELDVWLSEHEARPPAPDNACYVALGAYYAEGPGQKEINP